MYKKYNSALFVMLSLILSLSACKKYDGDSYDLSQKTSNYLRFTPGQELIFNGMTVDTTIDGEDYFYYAEDVQSFKIETRVAFTENVTVNYSITPEAGASENISAKLERQKNSQTEELTFPMAGFGGADSMIAGQIKLVSNSANLTLGYPQAGDNTTIDFVAFKPNVLHKY